MESKFDVTCRDKGRLSKLKSNFNHEKPKPTQDRISIFKRISNKTLRCRHQSLPAFPSDYTDIDDLEESEDSKTLFYPLLQRLQHK